MVDLIGMLNGVLGIIEKSRNLVLQSKQRDVAKYEAARREAQMVLQEVSELITKFSNTVDLILGVLGKGYPTQRYHGRHSIEREEIFKLNRKLYEISADMQILVTGLSQRFPEAEVQKICRLNDVCLQVLYIEDFIGVAFGSRSDRPFENPNSPGIGHYGLCLQYEDDLPFSRHSNIDRYIFEMFDYFDKLLKHLVNCKVQIAKSLQELSVNDKVT